MKLVFLGPPGAGKGTQAALLAKKLDIPHISTGEIFRHNIHNRTMLGKKANEFIKKGLLVPDEVTNAMVRDRLKKAEGFILDGYPRTLAQGRFLDSIVSLDQAIYFMLPKEEIIKRIAGRRTCPKCQAVYNIHFSPPKQKGICDACGTLLVQREDEKPEVVEKRISVYDEQTAPLVDYYKNRNMLVTIDATPSIDIIHQDVLRAIAKVK